DIDFIGIIRAWEMPGIAPPTKTYHDLPFLRADDRRVATTADYANEFPCCGRAFDFDRYHRRHSKCSLCCRSTSMSRRHAGRWPMIVGAQATDVRQDERRIGRTDQSTSFACLASHRPSKRQACTRENQSRLFRCDE